MIFNRTVASVVILAAGALSWGCADTQESGSSFIASSEEAILIDGAELQVVRDCTVTPIYAQKLSAMQVGYTKGAYPLIAAVRQGFGPEGKVVWSGAGTTKDIVVPLKAVAYGKGDYRIEVYSGKWTADKPAPWSGTWSDPWGKPCQPNPYGYGPTCNPDPPPPCPPE